MVGPRILQIKMDKFVTQFAISNYQVLWLVLTDGHVV